MAACGLQPGRKSSLEAQQQQHQPSLPNSSSSSTAGLGSLQPQTSTFDKDDNAKVMAEFAAAMMRAIKAYSDAEHNLQLRIGMKNSGNYLSIQQLGISVPYFVFC